MQNEEPKMLNLKSIAFLLFLLNVRAFAQLAIESIHYRSQIETAENYLPYVATIHSSILPLITTNADFSKEKSPIAVTLKKNRFQLKAYPIANLTAGINIGKPATYPIGNIGVGAGLDLSSKKLFFTAKYLPSYLKRNYVGDSIQNAIHLPPGSTRALSPNLFSEYEVLLAYRPNRFFTLIGGNGRNFFGEGYRSLIYSDNAGSTPFFKIETTFGSIKYVNLYNVWKDNRTPLNKSLDTTKFSAMHYISWNITKSFNISVFETVVWQGNDGPVNRGFDLNYINPVVFYRPVEYGLGSSDNVLLGLNMNYKFDHHNGIYTQFILDDFLLSELRARSRWWANKYGFQFGYKSDSFLNRKNLYFLAEFNVVRPFTYAHKFSTQSYGHLNQSVTHPIGANFYEILNITSFKKNKFSITNKLTYAGYGTQDSVGVNNGQNPFLSYTNRSGDYDHYIMQGFKKNVLNETLILEYPLYTALNLYLNFSYNWRIEKNRNGLENNHSFLIGLKSRLWNNYRDL